MYATDKEKENIYRDYHSKVFGYIYSRTNNLRDAEDIAANVFVKVYEKLEGFDPEKASLSTWIYTITHNSLIDYYRTRKVYEEIPETQEDGTSVEEEVCNAQMLETLAKALRQLDQRERDIIVLRFYSGRTLKDIAADMGISYAYIKVLQTRALDKLRKTLGH